MNFTTKGRYAIMAMVDLASHSARGPITLAEIAERQNIALNYLEQIFMRLRKNGLVKSVRGPGGGYVLPKDKMDIKIADIVVAVDESIKMTRCNNTKANGCMNKGMQCATHALWEGLGQQIYNYLDSISLGDMCDRNHPIFLEEISQENHSNTHTSM